MLQNERSFVPAPHGTVENDRYPHNPACPERYARIRATETHVRREQLPAGLQTGSHSSLQLVVHRLS